MIPSSTSGSRVGFDEAHSKSDAEVRTWFFSPAAP
jgi:hypothetical protein